MLEYNVDHRSMGCGIRRGGTPWSISNGEWPVASAGDEFKLYSTSEIIIKCVRSHEVKLFSVLFSMCFPTLSFSIIREGH